MTKQSFLSGIIAAALLAFPAAAADTLPLVDRWEMDRTQFFDAADVDLGELLYVARPVVVFANSPRDPAFVEQLDELTAELDQLAERDVIIVLDTDPEGRSDLRQRLRPRGFMMVLIGKDGQVKQRKPLPWTVREISRSIDKMPMRRREMRENPSGGN